ncbi:MAG: hypothetical protein BWY87_00297 [Deltaproteobacteria bacterium ADurb.Bin510]|nr:MAG: hypothetical protein BWY87_00297 [Deltaproteobacteria bacterium ADurb.Bin510]
MAGVEIISVRLSCAAAAEEVVGLCLAVLAAAPAGSYRILGSAAHPGDVSVQLELGRAGVKSPLGLRLAQVFENYGLVSHSLWHELRPGCNRRAPARDSIGKGPAA